MPQSSWKQVFRASRYGPALLVLALLVACAHMGKLAPSQWSLPWKQAAPPPPAPVHELTVAGSDLELPQAWDRNTLRIDLTQFAGEGGLSLQHLAGHDWPIRIAFAVKPGNFGHLDIRGDQRIVLAVPGGGSLAVLELPAGVYSPGTAALALHYGP